MTDQNAESSDPVDDDDDDTLTCLSCGGAVSEDATECGFCGLAVETPDPDNPYAGESYQSRFQ